MVAVEGMVGGEGEAEEEPHPEEEEEIKETGTTMGSKPSKENERLSFLI